MPTRSAWKRCTDCCGKPSWSGCQSKQLSWRSVERSGECRNTVREESFFNEGWPAWQSCLEPLKSLLAAFKSESRKQSRRFVFWEEYTDMVLVLLQFIKAERTENWKLHLSATAAMVPHFFSMDRVNYARWLPVYLSDMNILESSHPEVFQ